MLRVCIALLAFGIGGCGWLAKQTIDVCVDYKGRHVCVGRKDGTWTFSGDLTPEEQDEILSGLSGR